MSKNTVSGALSKRIAEQTANSMETSYDEMFGLKHDDERIVSLDVSLLVPHPEQRASARSACWSQSSSVRRKAGNMKYFRERTGRMQ